MPIRVRVPVAVVTAGGLPAVCSRHGETATYTRRVTVLARPPVPLTILTHESNVAHLRDHPEPTLTDLPVRVLLATLGRQVPDTAGVIKDLERLLGGASAPGPNLDFSKPA